MEIAVIGIGCRYPGANSARELFENILVGRRYFREIPSQRWALADYYDADRSRPDKTYCKQAAVLEGFEFNPSVFRIPQSTYRATDMAQWLALTVAKDALDDADVGEPPRAQTAVVLGNTLAGETSRAHLVRYRWPYARRVFAELLDNFGIAGEEREEILARVEERYKKPFPPVNEDNLAGGLANTIAGRVCNYFDFKGGGYTVDGACSSSLLAIQEACIGLGRGLCDLALAGGVDMSLDPFELVGFAKVGALSDSDIRVYDQRANGFLPGEGCGMVVLKRLHDAVRDGNRIYSVIRGVGYSSDGRGGITAPSVAGQSLAVDRAYSMADYSFADVELIEGHGTGTPVGDRTELQTFIDAKRRHGAADTHRCGIGSIKSLIGHTKAAAGVAGFIKATLAVYHRVLPPTLGLGIPNELFGTTTHIYPLQRGRRWGGEGPARAAVSSAGFGGINTHITVEASGPKTEAARRSIDVDYLLQSQQNAELLLLAADDTSELYGQVTTLAPVAKRLCHAELGDLAAHCARTVATKPLRLAIVADSAAGLHDKLQRVAGELKAQSSGGSEVDWSDAAAGIFMRRAKRVPRVAFMFPGQGAQSLDMSRHLRERYAFVASHWRACDEALEKVLSRRLSECVFTDECAISVATWRARSAALRETAIAQPAIVAASMAMTEVLQYLGIEPDVVLGHSLGEYTALWCAGALEKSEMLRLVAARGAAMGVANSTPGSMLSIAADADQVAELIAEVGGRLVIANRNAPTQVVVSGEASAVEALGQLCAVHEIPTSHLEVSGPFHSPLMDSAQACLQVVLPQQRWQSLNRLLISTTTGELINSTQEVIEALGRQIVAPVLFTQAIQTSLAENVDILIDVGPAPILCGLARRILGERAALAFASDVGVAGDWTGWLQTIGYAYVSGLPVIPARLFENRFVRPFKWPYEPKFVTSPCELAVEPLALKQRSVELARVSPALTPVTQSKPTAAADASVDDLRTPERLLEFMQRLIMDRFGYPADLIVPGARLLQDLNLDSIKSAEVIGEAMARIEVRADPALFAKLSLAEIAARLAAHAQRQTTPTLPTLDTDAFPPWVRTFAARLSEESLPAQARELSLGDRIVVAATAEDVGAAALVGQLQARGLSAELWRQGQPLPATKDIAGCIALLPKVSRDAAAGVDMLQVSRGELFAQPDFLLDTVRVVCSRFVPLRGSDAASANPPFFAVVMSSGTLLGQSGLTDRWDASPAAAAFVKSWFLEHPGCEARVLDMDPDTAAAAVAERLLDEIMSGHGYAESAYARSGRRHMIEYVPVTTALMSPAATSIADGEVVVVTGGAKGITAECLKSLVDHTVFSVALFGSTPFSESSSSSHASEPSVMEIGRTLETLRQKGVTARYYQCDVTDENAVRACVARVTTELGPVRGLMHAAGINMPHRLDGLSRPAFHSVLEPKMLGLLYLLRALELSALRQLVVFSSVIGASGMAGNADYAYANAWMGLVLKRLAAVHPRMQCRAFAFSVWDEVGMGARLGSVESLRRLGIRAIPREQGVQRFVELMQRQWRTPELVISARVSSLSTLRFADTQVSVPVPFAQNVILSHPGVELASEVVLDPARDRYLPDHNYNGALLFPAVVGMEAMSQVALRCIRVLLHEERAPALENMHFLRPIVVPAEGRRIRIHARADEPLQDGTLRVRVEIRSSLDGFASAAFTAQCVWRAGDRARKPVPIRAWPQPLPVDPRRDLYGSLFFQGPMFQHVAALHDVSPTHCIAQVRIPSSSVEDPSTPGPILGSCVVRDCFLHAIQVCVPEYRILPIGLDSLETHGLDGEVAYIVATERSRTAEEFTYDIDVVGEEGRILEQLRGYRCRIVDSFDDKKVLERVARMHAYALERRSPRVAAIRH